MTFDLAELARPMTRAEALRSGALVDTSACAAFLGFRFPSAVTIAVWDELVGTPDVGSTKEERAHAVKRLRQLWVDAQQAVARFRATGANLPSVRFTSRTASGRKVDLVLACMTDGRQPVLTIHLLGEL